MCNIRNDISCIVRVTKCMSYVLRQQLVNLLMSIYMSISTLILNFKIKMKCVSAVVTKWIVSSE